MDKFSGTDYLESLYQINMNVYMFNVFRKNSKFAKGFSHLRDKSSFSNTLDIYKIKEICIL